MGGGQRVLPHPPVSLEFGYIVHFFVSEIAGLKTKKENGLTSFLE
jgi:hypothetical protein